MPPHGTPVKGTSVLRRALQKSHDWKARLEAKGIAIEADFEWPAGGRSIYFRDPSGNSIEFAEPGFGELHEDLSARKIVVASHNAGKLREFADLMAPFGFEAKSAREYGLPEPDETGTTFEQNAYIKAHAAAVATGLPALSDDSGLVIDALGGQPGVYTANWAESRRRHARFRHGHAARRSWRCRRSARPNRRSAPAVRRGHLPVPVPMARPNISAARREGTLVWPPRGEMGFGYDPGVPCRTATTRTFGEMTAQEKHGWTPGQPAALSHRARAFQKFAQAKLGSA